VGWWDGGSPEEAEEVRHQRSNTGIPGFSRIIRRLYKSEHKGQDIRVKTLVCVSREDCCSQTEARLLGPSSEMAQAADK